MIDRLFAPLLTFALLIGGTATIVSTEFADAPAKPAAQSAQAASAPRVIALESVVITAKRKQS